MNERSAVELKTYDVLSALNIPFGRIDHEAAMTMEDCQCVEDALGVQACKNPVFEKYAKDPVLFAAASGDKNSCTKDFI